ncbi:MAG: FKBP-type peptidyl-prolyl cis-trans isomerase [Gemmatimonadaceae bacterium]|nr:FKBP-type peptidyl-prolyl cis-trans isomerase [Gemmatimonadaceae bacterium]
MTKSASGLYQKDLVVGTGRTAVANDSISTHYTGWLVNGQKFDSSRDRNQPFAFKLAVGRVIAGWDEGIQGMRVGGRRQLVIPPQLAYGRSGSGSIPPNSILVFEVELLGTP